MHEGKTTASSTNLGSTAHNASRMNVRAGVTECSSGLASWRVSSAGVTDFVADGVHEVGVLQARCHDVGHDLGRLHRS